MMEQKKNSKIQNDVGGRRCNQNNSNKNNPTQASCPSIVEVLICNGNK